MLTPRRIIGAVVLAAVIVGVAVAYSLFRSDLSRAAGRIAGGIVAATPCGPIEYALRGEGEHVLLFVHGAGGGFDQGLGFTDAIAGSGFRAVFVSRFGYLGTPLPADASAEAQADAHACLLDALGVERAVVVGVSAGAPSSMQFAIRHPDRTEGLVLLVPAAFVPKPAGEPVMDAPAATRWVFETALRSDFVYWLATKLTPDLLTETILATPVATAKAAPTEEQDRARQMLADILPIRQRRLGLLNDAAITSTLGRYELEAIRAPTLLVSVADDLFGTFESAKYSAEHITNAAFVGYQSGGHVWLGHHAELLSELRAFLKVVTEGAQ